MWSALDLYKFWVPSTHQDVDAVAIYKSDKGSITMTSHVLNNMTFETNFTIYCQISVPMYICMLGNSFKL